MEDITRARVEHGTLAEHQAIRRSAGEAARLMSHRFLGVAPAFPYPRDVPLCSARPPRH